MPLSGLPVQFCVPFLSLLLEGENYDSFENFLVDFLERVLHSLGTPRLCAVTCVPVIDGWKAVSSEGDSYHGWHPCDELFGIPEGWVELAKAEVIRTDQQRGWLKICAPNLRRQDLVRQIMPSFALLERALINRQLYLDFREDYHVLVDNTVDAIITIDSRGTILRFNRGAVTLFGYQPEEVIGKSLNCLVPPPYEAAHDGYIRRYLETGEKRIIGIGRRVPARRKDGSIFPAHLGVSEFRRDGSRYFLGTMRDLSDFVEARSRASVEERKHLSRELHDSVTQALFGIVLGAQAVKSSLHKPEQAKEAVDYVLHLAESALAEMRTLIFELRPESLESEGLLVCLRKQTEALSKRYQLKVEFQAPPQEPALELPLKHEAYRITMESLHNVVKHADASQCRVRMEKLPGEYQVEIHDNGKGFEVEKVPPTRMGLNSMRERVAQLGGRIEISSTPGEGTRVLVCFPANSS